MVQQTMFEALEAPRNAHEIRFNQFHGANPEVWHLWCQFTNEAISRGLRRVGSGLIIERIRWETSLQIEDETTDGKQLKIGNHHKVFYARKWNKENPDKQVFETRRIEGENDAS